MVGNDVVDLHDTDADISTYRSGFDARVFRAAEREAIEGDVLGPATRWQLWAAKEACYKVARQADPAVVFSPRAFEVWFENRWAEVWMPVRHASGTYLVVLEPGNDRVHAIAAPDASDYAHVLCSIVPSRDAPEVAGDDPSAQVRHLACEAVAKHLGIEFARVEITRDARIPRLAIDGDPCPVSLSLSHHGRWLAYACDTRGLVHA